MRVCRPPAEGGDRRVLDVRSGLPREWLGDPRVPRGVRRKRRGVLEEYEKTQEGQNVPGMVEVKTRPKGRMSLEERDGPSWAGSASDLLGE